MPLTDDQMAAIVADLEWMPGWTIEFRTWDTVKNWVPGPPGLMIQGRVPNTYRPDEIVTPWNCRRIPEMESEQELLEWIVDFLDHIARHESREWFRWRGAGRPIFDPH